MAFSSLRLVHVIAVMTRVISLRLRSQYGNDLEGVDELHIVFYSFSAYYIERWKHTQLIVQLTRCQDEIIEIFSCYNHAMILLDKPVGVTPLAAINRLREQYPTYTSKKLGYAGRLDPMAEGLLLILEDEENKKRKTYESLEKTYTFSVLFGVATDTYDLLGKIVSSESTDLSTEQLKKSLTSIIPSFLGSNEQLYPPYSSYHIDGKPLYWWAREKRLNDITIPTKKITISQCSITNVYSLPVDRISKHISQKISLISGDFRQEEISEEWRVCFQQMKQKYMLLANFTITCSSGTYVRGLVTSIGSILHIPTVTYHIRRTAIGTYTLTDAVKIG